MMTEKKQKPLPGDGLRSLKSTAFFRAVNYELYVRPNRGIMMFGAITMLACMGYLFFMRMNSDNSRYYTAVIADGTVDLKKKTSKWILKRMQDESLYAPTPPQHSKG